MLDSIKDWFVDRLHKYMDAAREIVENDEGIRSAETYYSTVKATLKKEAALLTKTFCIGMGGILATLLCGWLAELLGHGILKVISAVLALLCVCIVAFILLAVIGLLLMLRTFFFANRSMADEWQKVVSDEQYADYVEQSKFLTMTRDKIRGQNALSIWPPTLRPSSWSSRCGRLSASYPMCSATLALSC